MKRIVSVIMVALLLCAVLCGCLEDTTTKTQDTTVHSHTAEETTAEKVTAQTVTATVTSEITTEIVTTEAPTTQAPTTAPHIHSFSAATCTKPKTCTECGATSGSKSDHIFSDGACIICNYSDPDYVSEPMVWIPTNGGKKYHTYSGCSNMKNPEQVTKSYAKSMGFEACKKCH